MKTLFRIVAALFAATAVKFFTFWVLLASFSSGDWKADLHGNWRDHILTASVLSWVCAVFAGWSTWQVARVILGPEGVFLCALFGALLVGAIGFAGGFFGTAFLMPHSNQGPLLGIFLTGPVGCLLGAVGGGLYGLARRKHEAEKVSRLTPSQSLLSGEINTRRNKHLQCHSS